MTRVAYVAAMSVILAVGEPARAEGPPLEFFAGTYTLRMDLFDGGVRVIEDGWIMTPSDGRLAVESCFFRSGELHFPWPGPPQPRLEGRLYTSSLRCDYFIDEGNYPVLDCFMGIGANDFPDSPMKFTLHFQHDSSEADELTCPD